MGPIALTIKRCSTDCRASEFRRFDKLRIQNIYFKVHFPIFVSDKRVHVRDGDVQVTVMLVAESLCWRLFSLC